MKQSHRPNISPRTALSGVSLAALLALAFNACTDSSNGGPGPGGEYDSLHIPRSILLDSGAATFPICAACHNANGVGSYGFAPPLRHSDYFMAERLRPVRILLMGLPNAIDSQTIITVNGLEYDGGNNQMPALAHDEQWSNLKLAGVLTYIRSMLNDSLSSTCNPHNTDEYGFAICTKTARPAAEVENDSIAVWEVKAIRDNLLGAGLLTP